MLRFESQAHAYQVGKAVAQGKYDGDLNITREFIESFWCGHEQALFEAQQRKAMLADEPTKS